ncbi:ependymin-1-like [Lampris incognitus]|uniref:ependymin-1-like n=1 Tax=Lampris incognitus TaxID=2546036 RepID=UPI0024B55DF7|nr:ependymin-1-like [Lampris incognitus]XP_056141416.1 ependymin-1-like [Lampris incognitus]
MHAATKLSIFMCLIATSFAEHHRSCDSPNMTGILMVSDLRQSNTVGAYTYDSVANKLRFTSFSTDTFNSSLNLDVLFFFDEGIFYEIDGKNQSCEKKSLQSSIHAMEIPSNAEFLSNMTIGSTTIEGEGIKISMWKGTVPGTKAQYMMGSSMGCLPLSFTCISETILIFSNTGIEMEIKDPDRLVVPSFCEAEVVEDTPEGKVNSFFSLFH